MRYKVGDLVRRKPDYNKLWWKEYCGARKLNPYGVFRVVSLSVESETVWLHETEGSRLNSLAFEKAVERTYSFKEWL